MIDNKEPKDVYPANSALHLAVFSKFCDIVLGEFMEKFCDGTEGEFAEIVRGKMTEQLALLMWVKSMPEGEAKKIAAEHAEKFAKKQAQKVVSSLNLN